MMSNEADDNDDDIITKEEEDFSSSPSKTAISNTIDDTNMGMTSRLMEEDEGEVPIVQSIDKQQSQQKLRHGQNFDSTGQSSSAFSSSPDVDGEVDETKATTTVKTSLHLVGLGNIKKSSTHKHPAALPLNSDEATTMTTTTTHSTTTATTATTTTSNESSSTLIEGGGGIEIVPSTTRRDHAFSPSHHSIRSTTTTNVPLVHFDPTKGPPSEGSGEEDYKVLLKRIQKLENKLNKQQMILLKHQQDIIHLRMNVVKSMMKVESDRKISNVQLLQLEDQKQGLTRTRRKTNIKNVNERFNSSWPQIKTISTSSSSSSSSPDSKSYNSDKEDAFHEEDSSSSDTDIDSNIEIVSLNKSAWSGGMEDTSLSATDDNTTTTTTTTNSRRQQQQQNVLRLSSRDIHTIREELSHEGISSTSSDSTTTQQSDKCGDNSSVSNNGSNHNDNDNDDPDDEYCEENSIYNDVVVNVDDSPTVTTRTTLTETEKTWHGDDSNTTFSFEGGGGIGTGSTGTGSPTGGGVIPYIESQEGTTNRLPSLNNNNNSTPSQSYNNPLLLEPENGRISFPPSPPSRWTEFSSSAAEKISPEDKTPSSSSTTRIWKSFDDDDDDGDSAVNTTATSSRITQKRSSSSLPHDKQVSKQQQEDTSSVFQLLSSDNDDQVDEGRIISDENTGQYDETLS